MSIIALTHCDVADLCNFVVSTMGWIEKSFNIESAPLPREGCIQYWSNLQPADNAMMNGILSVLRDGREGKYWWGIGLYPYITTRI